MSILNNTKNISTLFSRPNTYRQTSFIVLNTSADGFKSIPPPPRHNCLAIIMVFLTWYIGYTNGAQPFLIHEPPNDLF